MPVAGERKPLPLVRMKFVEGNGTLSADGKLLAYESNESGQNEVYVQEFPQARSKWQVSAKGGAEPYWRADGRELYYRAPDARLMAVPVQTGEPFNAGTPEALFQARFASVQSRGLYRPSADGQRFLVLSPLGRDAIAPATVVLNWPNALR
jgi:hypothetical protein